MANFSLDNEDIQFLFQHMDVTRLSEIQEEGFKFPGQFDYAPVDAADAMDNYQRILENLGELAAEQIAPTAPDTGVVGNVHNPAGSVTYTPGIAKAIKLLGQADLMGFTLPYRFGGI